MQLPKIAAPPARRFRPAVAENQGSRMPPLAETGVYVECYGRMPSSNATIWMAFSCRKRASIVLPSAQPAPSAGFPFPAGSARRRSCRSLGDGLRRPWLRQPDPGFAAAAEPQVVVLVHEQVTDKPELRMKALVRGELDIGRSAGEDAAPPAASGHAGARNA